MPTATGAIRNNCELTFSRTVPLTVDEAWSALTEPEKLATWYGPWSGDPHGEIAVTMIAEEGQPTMAMRVLSCEKPRGYVVQALGEYAWRLGIEIEPGAEEGTEAGHAVVTLVHYLAKQDAEMVDSIGPGWDYYLDCFVAAVTGGNPRALDFNDYFPALQGHYEELRKQLIFLDEKAPGAGLLASLLDAKAEVLDSIRAFESERHAMSLLDDSEKTDKRTTVFVNTADLVWGWIAQHPGEEHSLFAVAKKVSGLGEDELMGQLGELVEGWEFRDPEFVAVVEADGGLRF